MILQRWRSWLSPIKSKIRNPKLRPRMEHGPNTEKNPCFLCVSSVAQIYFFGLFFLAAFQPLRADEQTREQQITDIQKQIEQLNKKLDQLKQDKGKESDVKAGTISPEWIKTMSWRCIGPAAMSGRIVAVAVNEADPTTYWIATASGGLLKT